MKGVEIDGDMSKENIGDSRWKLVKLVLDGNGKEAYQTFTLITCCLYNL